MNLSNIYLNSLFSGVAYANKTGDHTITSELNSQTILKQFTDNPDTVYEDRVTDENRFLVSDFSTTSAPNTSGFAAVVVQDRATNQVTIAFRGTEPRDGLDRSADADILVSGCARAQIVDMYNYVARLRAAVGETVAQYQFNDDGVLEVAPSATGLGIIKPGDVLNLTGHSLGGHLAMACSRFSATTQQGQTAH